MPMKTIYRYLRTSLLRRMAWRINEFGRYFDDVVLHREPGDAGADLAAFLLSGSRTHVASLPSDSENAASARNTLYVFNGTLNSTFDIQGLLRSMHERMRREDRVAAVIYNPYLWFVFHLLDRCRIRTGLPFTTFVTTADVHELATLAGFEVVRIRPTAFLPLGLLGLGRVIDALLGAIPGVRWLSWAWVFVLRPVKPCAGRPSLSVLIPARNERGNIEAALRRMPAGQLGPLEILFVEGNSTDGTWEEILRVRDLYVDRFTIKVIKQTGRGKCDAVRLGLAQATGDLLTILDADLTMPPEQLVRFYNAFVEGKGDFINGSRLVYPMEGEAMRFLNRIGNIFFAKALSSALEARLGDSLCGTKLFTRRDYARFGVWRGHFGDFDPFGDFELLFPAAVMGLGVANVPIRYLARTYGSTNIHRFRHGFMLLRMTIVGFLRIRLGLW
jgi:hypothetical protein